MVVAAAGFVVVVVAVAVPVLVVVVVVVVVGYPTLYSRVGALKYLPKLYLSIYTYLPPEVLSPFADDRCGH